MHARFAIFFTVALAIWGGMHAFVGWRLLAPVRLSPGAMASAWIGIALLALFGLAGVVVPRFLGGGEWGQAVKLAAYLYMGGLSLLFAALLAKEAIAAVLTAGTVLAAGREAIDDERRRLFVQAANAGVLALVGAGMLSGYRQATRLAPVVRVEVASRRLHPALDGFRIVQISDIHVGAPLAAKDLEAIVARVNSLEPDLVAITGDLIDGRVQHLAADIASLADLRALHGVWFCTGNHEYYSGAEEWCAAIDRLGVRVLNNRHEVVRVGDAELVVAGVTDFDAASLLPSHRSDPAQAVAGAPDGAFRLLLAHQPKSAAAAQRAGVDLQLSGHTHGGQYWPGTWLVGLVQPFAVGLHRVGDFAIYTSRGTGCWGPPLRIGAPNEITEIVLRSV